VQRGGVVMALFSHKPWLGYDYEAVRIRVRPSEGLSNLVILSLKANHSAKVRDYNFQKGVSHKNTEFLHTVTHLVILVFYFKTKISYST
jgi:hypothetical protein